MNENGSTFVFLTIMFTFLSAFLRGRRLFISPQHAWRREREAHKQKMAPLSLVWSMKKHFWGFKRFFIVNLMLQTDFLA